MEKLQNALQNARKKRAISSAVVPKEHRKVEAPRPDVEIDRLWTRVSEIQINPKDLTENRILAFEASNAAAPFDILRTKVMLEMKKNGWTRLAITSPTPGCGKTTTAMNLAFGLTRQEDKQAILFDLDLRRPGVSRYLGHKPDQDVRELYEGRISFENYAVRVGENLAIAGIRNTVPDPASMLNSEKTAAVVDQIQGTYTPDIMIFDLPPFLVNDDTRGFLKNVDCALLVAQANETRVDQIDSCEREVALHTNVLGIVLNQCETTSETIGYDYDSD
ncbi:MAG: CpsD/CapB family tyrosine-protein kinase [Pseudomonadota bacterium]